MKPNLTWDDDMKTLGVERYTLLMATGISWDLHIKHIHSV